MPETTPQKRLTYQPSFDGLRSLGMFNVLCAHLVFVQPILRYPASLMPVDMFFVMSGYLITTLLLLERDSTGRVSLRAFYIRRFARIYPLVVVIVAVMIVCRLVAPDSQATPSWWFITGAMFYFSNFVAIFNGADAKNAWVSLWSLSIEEQFYAIWPVVLLFTMGAARRLRRPLALLAVAVVAMWTLRSWTLYRSTRSFPEDPSRHLLELVDAWRLFDFSTFYRPDGILIGAALALILADPERRLARFVTAVAHRGRFVVIGVLIAITARTMGPAPWQAYWGLGLFNICIALLLTELLTHPGSVMARFLSLRPLVWVGRRTYFIYVVHLAVFVYVIDVLGLTSLPWLAFVSGLIFLASGISYRYYENPIRKWGQRLSSRIISTTMATGAPPRSDRPD